MRRPVKYSMVLRGPYVKLKAHGSPMVAVFTIPEVALKGWVSQ